MESPRSIGPLLAKVAFAISWAFPLAWVIYFFGIYLGYGNWKVRGHQEFAKNGISQIQPAAEMEELFDDCRHYIVYTGRESVSTWNATAFFGRRYELTMQVPIDIASATSGSMIAEPEFFLKEVEAVTVSPSGQLGASYSRVFNFEAREWRKVYDSDGGFESIGFTLKTSPVPNFQKFASATRPSN